MANNPLVDPAQPTYDREHYLDEALMEIQSRVRNKPSKQAKLRFLDGVIGKLTAYYDRVDTDSELPEEVQNPNDTQLATGPIRSI